MIDVKKEGVLTSGLDMREGERCPYILPGGEKRVEVSIEGKDFAAEKAFRGTPNHPSTKEKYMKINNFTQFA